MTILLVAGLLSFVARTTEAVGPFLEVARVSDFIRAAREPGLSGSVTRADSRGQGASFFSLAGTFPVRSSFLMRLETSYVTLAVDDEVIDGFGDVFLSIKAHAWRGDRKAVVLATNLRFGAGETNLFPYSTASSDVEIGVAFVDSLGIGGGSAEPARYLSYWIAASGDYIVRTDDRLKDSELLGNYASGGVGVGVGVTRWLDAEAGGLALLFSGGAVREIYFLRFSAALSPVSSLRVTVQGERGDWRDRAVDASASVGLAVNY